MNQIISQWKVFNKMQNSFSWNILTKTINNISWNVKSIIRNNTAWNILKNITLVTAWKLGILELKPAVTIKAVTRTRQISCKARDRVVYAINRS